MIETETSGLGRRYRAVRSHSIALAASLSPEDQCVQSMPDASPVKWHLAHTTWFFETLVLRPQVINYRPFDEQFATLFNSYYEALGPRYPRPHRGLLTRPDIARVHAYRAAVDEAMLGFLERLDANDNAAIDSAAIVPLIELGLNHEQQHQELMLTDILHLMSCNPMLPAVRDGVPARAQALAAGWHDYEAVQADIGHTGPAFCFDNETPAHRVLLQPYSLANRLVTNAEYQAFIDDRGYQTPSLWLSEGWAMVQSQGWRAPLYWLDDGREFSLYGAHRRQADQPVRHLSFHESVAYAEWAQARLPTEFEWESAVSGPRPPEQAFGELWQWTRSSYDPYPRFRPPAGAVGEYNGKFMVGQIVLRGSSLATPPGHHRATYRNFFSPASRWQFMGLRLARDL
jgi:ergothioneine biosynthesis protein EgtB